MISRIHLARITTALLILASLPACYTARVLSGGAGLLAKREPIDEVLADDGLSADERSKLELSQRIVDFAVSDLQLPDNGSYRSYVRLDRPHVVWNVVATPALSIEPLEWCFPIVGCVSYRGYFKEKRAGDFAAKLERKGNDVAVRGTDAYSTLGRFRDPVLSTFLNRRGIDLAALLFHEMAHQRLYIKNDTAFNESFATVVEHEGVRRWLVAQGRESEIAGLEHERDLEQRFVSLLLDWRGRLDRLFRSDLPDAEKHRRKEELLAGLRAEYERAKRDWGGDDRYDAWFDRPLNNARLAAVSNYFDLVAPLEMLLRHSAGTMEDFYSEVERLGRLAPDERRRQLLEPTPRHDSG
jgi:predicted aminopeptidase